MTPEILLALLLGSLAVIQGLALFILGGMRSGIRDIWTAVTALGTTMHDIDKRVAVLETAIERRDADRTHQLERLHL